MSDQDDEMRDFTRNLFADPRPFALERTIPTADEPAAPEPDRRNGNVVPREGTTVGEGPTGDDITRQWVNDLFTHTEIP